jgi:hypothetical protein
MPRGGRAHEPPPGTCSAPRFSFALCPTRPVSKRRHLDDVLRRLEAAEEQFLQSDCLAPMPRGGRVQVRIAGVVCQLRVEPADFHGWGVFRPQSHTQACLVRPATFAERQAYLELFPRVRLILCQKHGGTWLALPAHQGDRRLSLRGAIPVRLVEEGQAFELIEARFDGAQGWYEGPDTRRDPAAAAYLRESLRELLDPERLDRPGLTAEERAAYTFAHAARLRAERDRVEGRLQQALAHAGGELLGYVERDDCYRIEFEVDGRRQVSVVGRDDLAVQVAGICLSGRDAQFDLQSLVGVVREAQGEGVLRIGRENQGMAEEDYWRAHPPAPTAERAPNDPP